MSNANDCQNMLLVMVSMLSSVCSYTSFNSLYEGSATGVEERVAHFIMQRQMQLTKEVHVAARLTSSREHVTKREQGIP